MPTSLLAVSMSASARTGATSVLLAMALPFRIPLPSSQPSKSTATWRAMTGMTLLRQQSRAGASICSRKYHQERPKIEYFRIGANECDSSNEPDNAGQANLSPQDTATVYKRYMQQFKGQALLATPAVTNGGGSTGLNFLGEFLENCQDCHFDMINIHHYVQRSSMNVDQAVSALKSYIETNVPALQAKYKQIQGLPIMVGEVSFIPFNVPWFLPSPPLQENFRIIEDHPH